MPSSTKALNNAIIRIISGPTIWRIRFGIGSEHVSRVTFKRVVSALAKNEIAVEYDSRLPKKTFAYIAGEKKLAIPFGTSTKLLQSDLDAKSGIVHESVHAYFHLTKGKLDKTRSETLAYMAQSMYLLVVAGAVARKNAEKRKGVARFRIFHEAIKIIDHFGLLTLVRTLSTQDVEPLATAIRRHPLYR